VNNTHKYRLGRGAAATLALAAAFAIAPGADAAQRTLQLAEDGTVTERIAPARAASMLAAPGNRVCRPGAKWIRLGFKSLELKPYDSLVIRSSGGDVYSFEGNHWNGRAFHARALRGDCVEIQPYFGNPDSSYEVESYDYGLSALEATPVVVAGAGDICDSSGNACAGTSDLIVAIAPVAVFTAGDNAYSSGTLTEYNSRYAPTWGRFKELTSPTPGNHEYNTTGASGYFDYFNGVGAQTGPAGDRSKGYYSWDVGEWHFIALNTMSGGTVGSAQITWLQNDLAANTKPCTAAYFHHPLVSRGHYTGYDQVKPFWDALYAAKADLVLVGHDHNYQRYGKMNPNQAAASDGIRQVLIGTGGRAFYGLNGSHPLLEASNASTHGVLKLSLSATGYTGEFVPKAGSSYTDSFSGTCNKGAPPANNMTLDTVRDVTVKSNGTRDNGAILYADGDDAGLQLRGLMGWNLGAAAGLDITAATVSLNVSNLSTGAYDLYQVTGAWTEADATYAGATLGTKLGTVTPSGTGVRTIALNAAGVQLVEDWASGAVANHGVVLVNASGVIDGVDWSSREGVSAPKLTLSYSGSGGNAAPVANFSAAVSGLGVNFTDSSTDSDGTIVSRAWSFGDGTTSTATSPSKTYAAAGTYTVSLTVTDNGGATHTKTVSVTATASGAQTYSNTVDYTISDNTTVNSPIAVSGRSGNAPSNASVTVAIEHTYQGDLKVDLMAPDGTLYSIHNRTGGSADDVKKTVTLNLSSEALNGTWTLRVNDNGNGDVGYIDNWSVTF
jgi:subtilisin-like proprotein convertase family protein